MSSAPTLFPALVLFVVLVLFPALVLFLALLLFPALVSSWPWCFSCSS
ncbi:hypothetical protein [Couchioplanes azureus]|nr:hypothetical protein [Couchioplanes caeruleus]